MSRKKKDKGQTPEMIEATASQPDKGRSQASNPQAPAARNRPSPEVTLTGNRLRTAYGHVVAEPIPDNMIELLKQLD